MSYFLQTPPVLDGNVFVSDSALQSVLLHRVPADALQVMRSDLEPFGKRVTSGDVFQLSRDALEPSKYPRLQQFDGAASIAILLCSHAASLQGWGRRVDRIVVCEEWKKLHDVAAQEGLIALGYERRLGVYSRLHQMLKLMLFGPSSALVTCPLAMTDGAARLIEQLDKRAVRSPFLHECFARFTTRDAARFWTSGQWMTERTGGSDVANTESIAVPVPDSAPPLYNLYGYKYFTSATTADVAFTLARVRGADGSVVHGSRGLSLFVLRLRRTAEGGIQNIRVHRLKDKLGTRTLPTAELELCGVPAERVGELGDGVRNISLLFNVTRVYAAVGSAGGMMRMLALMRDYAHKRVVFGAPLAQQPAHLTTLASLEVEYRGALHLAVDLSIALGMAEVCTNQAEQQQAEALLRVLTPLSKLYCSKRAVAFMSEALEAFGAAGYMEDTGLPAALRDAQVNTIWEGTTNVLALDLLRAAAKEPEAIPVHFRNVVHQRLASRAHSEADEDIERFLRPCRLTISNAMEEALDWLAECNADPALAQAGARQLAFTLSRLYAGSLLVEHGERTRKLADAWTAHEWCFSESMHLARPSALTSRLQRELALATDNPQTSRTHSTALSKL